MLGASRTRPPLAKDCISIALVSCAVLIYEIAITRVLSVVLWYHFAFLAISAALLGLGLPGVWFAWRKPSPAALPFALLLGSLVAPGSLALLFRAGGVVRLDSAAPGLHVFGNAELLLTIGCVCAPLLAFGAAVCLILSRARGDSVAWVYGADLLGATLGAILVVPLMSAVPTPLIVAGTGLLPLAALAIEVRQHRIIAAGLSAVLVGLLLWGKPFALHFSKSYVEPKDIVYEKWTPTARVTIFPDIFYLKDRDSGFGWGMGSRYVPKPISQMWIEQDGSAGTPITQLRGEPRDLEHLLFDVTSTAYQVRPPASVCVIGAGGGRDVLTALSVGAKRVDAVELNPGIFAALTGPFREFSGNIYGRPGVFAHVAEGRSFLTRTERRFDLVQISLIDSWAATAAGAYSLSENYLYTLEALRMYLRRTTPNGVVTISRWVSGERELEGARLAEMVRQALTLEGVSDPGSHLLIAQAWSVGTFIYSKTEFSAAERERFNKVAQTRGFRELWPSPLDAEPSVITDIAREGSASGLPAGVDLSPATDDRPFFFQTVSPFAKLSEGSLNRWSNNEHSVAMLRFLLGVVTAVTVGLFFAPALVQRFRGCADTTARVSWIGSAYFLGIGLAFMLVEIPWLQRFVLYLGHPSYATTVVLASLLLGAGAGAITAGRVSRSVLARWGFALPLFVFGVDTLLGPAFASTLGFAFPVRAALTAVALVPAGFLMGFAFPFGLRTFGTEHTAWFWAINGAAGVVASVLALIVAIAFGFRATVLAGSGVYLLCWSLAMAGARAVAQSGEEPGEGRAREPALDTAAQ